MPAVDFHPEPCNEEDCRAREKGPESGIHFVPWRQKLMYFDAMIARRKAHLDGLAECVTQQIEENFV